MPKLGRRAIKPFLNCTSQIVCAGMVNRQNACTDHSAFQCPLHFFSLSPTVFLAGKSKTLLEQSQEPNYTLRLTHDHHRNLQSDFSSEFPMGFQFSSAWDPDSNSDHSVQWERAPAFPPAQFFWSEMARRDSYLAHCPPINMYAAFSGADFIHFPRTGLGHENGMKEKGRKSSFSHGELVWSPPSQTYTVYSSSWTQNHNGQTKLSA